jgi:hypothetical protein
MMRTYLGVQAAIVVTVVGLVSWPEFRPVRVLSVWRYAPTAVARARTGDAARFAGERVAARPPMHLDETAFTAPIGPSTPAYFVTPSVMAAGGRVNALLGVARTSLNASIPYARVVLRNILTGQALAETVANEDGQFTFVDVDANTYIVELLDADGAVVATSTMVTMARGELRLTEVRVAAAAATVKASLGNRLTPTAPQATMVAASNNVTRTTTSQATAVSPGPRP